MGLFIAIDTHKMPNKETTRKNDSTPTKDRTPTKNEEKSRPRIQTRKSLTKNVDKGIRIARIA